MASGISDVSYQRFSVVERGPGHFNFWDFQYIINDEKAKEAYKIETLNDYSKAIDNLTH